MGCSINVFLLPCLFSTDFGARMPKFKSWLCHTVVLSLQESYSTFPGFLSRKAHDSGRAKGWCGKVGSLRCWRWCLLPGAICYQTDQLCSVPPAHLPQGTWILPKRRTENETLEACTYILLYFSVKSKWDFPGGSVVKNPPASVGDVDSISGSGRSAGKRNGNPLGFVWEIPWIEESCP